MLQPEYILLISQLISATDLGKLQWKKAESPNAYEVNVSLKTRVHLDTYFWENNEGIRGRSVDMTIFNDDTDEIVDEIVVGNIEATKSDYDLLNALYETARKQYSYKKIKPVLDEIMDALGSL